MPQPTGFYPPLKVDTTAKRVVSNAGAVLLVATAGKVGLDRTLSAALSPWRKQWAVLDPGKILLDLAVSVAVGGDCLADIALLREESGVFGAVASDPTVSRLIATLAEDAPKSLAAINSARAACRATAWSRAGAHAPDHRADAAHPLIIDLDASLVGRVNWRRNTPPRPTREDLGFRCSRSSTTAPGAPGNRCRSCSGRETLDPTPPPITSA